MMLDADLADVYGVRTKALNQQVKRNIQRFPSDFAFQLSREELDLMRSQNVTSSRRNFRTMPWVFTEHGAIMLASMLNSQVAVEASVSVVRAFVRLREVLASNRELAVKLQEIESKLQGHDKAIQDLFRALRQLISDPVPSKQPPRAIGFHVKDRMANGEVSNRSLRTQ